MKRLFIAAKVNLSPQFVQHTENLQKCLAQEEIIWVQKEMQHITLRFLGKTPDMWIAPLCEKMTQICQKTPAFDMQLNKLGVFGSHYAPQVLWYGFEEFTEFKQLFQEVEQAAVALGFEKKEGNCVPHLTLGRIKKLSGKKRFWKIFEENALDFSQTIRISEFILFRSRLEHDGPIYTELQEFPLKQPENGKK